MQWCMCRKKVTDHFLHATWLKSIALHIFQCAGRIILNTYSLILQRDFSKQESEKYHQGHFLCASSYSVSICGQQYFLTLRSDFCYQQFI